MAGFRQKWLKLNLALRIVIYIISCLIILLIILQIVISIWGNRYIAYKLKRQVAQSTDSTYSIRFNKLNLDLYAGTITIHKLRIHADTSVFTHPSGKKPPNTLYQGTVGKFSVKGIDVIHAALGHELNIGEILIKKPDLTAINNPHPVLKDTSGGFPSIDSTIYAAISNNYHEFKLKKFKIRKARLLSVQSGDTLKSIEGLNMTLKNIKVDTATVQSGRTFITGDISMKARHLMVNLSDSLDRFKLGGLSVSSRSQSITLDSLQLIPLYPKFKYSEKNGQQKDRIDLTISKVKLRQVDFPASVDSGSFHCHYAEIDHAVFKDFHSMLPPPPPHKNKPLYNTALFNLHQKIKIDSLKIKNSYVSYAEYHHPAPKAGKVTFEDLNATFRNLTNYPQAIKNSDSIKVEARAKVMGKGQLTVHWIFPLNTHNAFHKVYGSLSGMPLTSFNRALKYIAFVKIDRGKLNHLKFNFTATNDRSSGTLIMKYQNLKISVLNKKDMKQSGILKNLITFAANKFIIRTNNTPESGMQAGKIDFQRITYKSTWNFWWKSLLTGIKSSIK